MEKIYPIYTTVARNPETICQELNEEVFEFPFFNEGVASSMINPGRTFTLSSAEISADKGCLDLKGLIFNVSHCGSTLLCRMVNQLQRVRVVSEPEAINGLLLSKILYDIDDDEIIGKLREIVKLYQQKENSKESLIIKLTSWNIYFVKLFQRAFPALKWIYIDRETETLTKSLMKSDGGFIDWWNHPVSVLRERFIESKGTINTKKQYVREMIKGHRFHANNNQDSNSLLVEYPKFIKDYEGILHHFKLEATAEEIKQSKAMLQYDAKLMRKKKFFDLDASDGLTHSS